MTSRGLVGVVPVGGVGVGVGVGARAVADGGDGSSHSKIGRTDECRIAVGSSSRLLLEYVQRCVCILHGGRLDLIVYLWML